MAASRPFIVKSPAGDRVDNYYWLRDDTRTNPEVLAYLAKRYPKKWKILPNTKKIAEAKFQTFGCASAIR